MSKLIRLSGHNPDNLCAVVDDEDFERASAHRWFAHRAKRSLTVYAKAARERSTIYLHRFILGAGDGQIVDHVDGDGLNCRRLNLRFVSQSENVLAGIARRAFDAWEDRL